MLDRSIPNWDNKISLHFNFGGVFSRELLPLQLSYLALVLGRLLGECFNFMLILQVNPIGKLAVGD